MPEEAKLIRDILSGDAKAFRQLIQRYENLVGKMVYRMISKAEDRQEVAQDVYLTIYQKLATFRSESKLSTWIARIAYYKCIDYYKKKGGKQFFESTEDLSDAQLLEQHLSSGTPEKDMILKERKQTIAQAIEMLPPNYKVVLSLYYTDQLSYHEIGEVLKMPDGTVKNYMFRARRLLRKILERDYKKGELRDD